MDYFSKHFFIHGEIQCLNCVHMALDKARILLRQADLIIVVLRQRPQDITRIFEREGIAYSNIMYLLVDYFPDSEWNLARITKTYRVVMRRLICIPYNTAYEDAKERGEPGRYLNAGVKPCCFQTGLDFERELLRAVHCALKALETSAL